MAADTVQTPKSIFEFRTPHPHTICMALVRKLERLKSLGGVGGTQAPACVSHFSKKILRVKTYSELDGFGNVYRTSQCLNMGEVGC
jgi:hypothetical protein